MKTGTWTILLKYGLGVGVLAWIIYNYWNPNPNIKDDPGLSGLIERPLHVGPFFLAALIAAAGLLITFLRWHMLVRAVGIEFRRSDAIRLGLIGYYFTNFLPSVGGDMLKAYYIARGQTRRTLAVATVIVDRAIGLWALAAFVSIIGGVFWLMENPLLYGSTGNPYMQMIVRASILVSSTSLAVFVLAGLVDERRSEQLARALQRIPKLGSSAAEFWRACWIYRQKTGAVILAVLMSFVGHLGWVLVFQLAIQAFETQGEIATFQEHLIIVPVGMTAQAMFPAPGGVGGGEFTYSQLYLFLHKPPGNGVAGSLAQRVIFLGLGFIGYLFYNRSRTAKTITKTDEETPISAFPPNTSAAPLMTR